MRTPPRCSRRPRSAARSGSARQIEQIVRGRAGGDAGNAVAHGDAPVAISRCRARRCRPSTAIALRRRRSARGPRPARRRLAASMSRYTPSRRASLGRLGRLPARHVEAPARRRHLPAVARGLGASRRRTGRRTSAASWARSRAARRCRRRGRLDDRHLGAVRGCAPRRGDAAEPAPSVIRSKS